MKIKIDTSKARPLLQQLGRSALVYLVYFLIFEIIVSGGRYENDPYLFAITTMTVVIVEYLLLDKKTTKKLKGAVFQGLYFAVVAAVLDLLIVNYLLLHNLLATYTTWTSIATYLIMLTLPIAIYFVFRKKQKTYQVDELLTNQKPTL